MTPDQYCQNKAAKSGSSFYYSFLFLPEEKRQAITALYAFCRETDDAVDECSDSELARTKISWWRDEVDKLYEGCPQHPATRALETAIHKYDLPKELFVEILDGMEMDLDTFRYQTFKELSLYLYRAAAVVGLLSAEIFCYTDRQTLKYAHDLGFAFQLTNIIRDVFEDAQRGRIYLPIEDLEKFKVSEADILSGKQSKNIQELMKFEADRAREYYERAFANLPDIDRQPQRSGIAMAAIYQATLDEIELDGFRVLEHRISLTPIRKLWIAWKTVRREKRLCKKINRRNAT